MDPVDKAVWWAHFTQRKIYDAFDSISNSNVVTNTSEIINNATDSIFDLYKHKLDHIPEPKEAPTNMENIIKSKRLLAFILGGAISGGVYYKYYFKQNKENIITIRNNKKYIRTDKRRRAKRLENGARTNVVIIIGSVLEPLVRIVANDLDKRGFIVYITAINDREIFEIQAEKSSDIRPFKLNSSSEDALSSQIALFNKHINSPMVPFDGAHPLNLKLMGVLVIPDLYYPVGPVENMSAKSWSDCLNAKIISPLILFSNEFINVIRNNNAIEFEDRTFNVTSTKLILLTPSLISSINLPFHALETVAVNSLSSIFEAFAREISSDTSINLEVINLKIGALNIFNHPNNKGSSDKIKAQLSNQVLGWGDHMKSIYGQNFKHICLLGGPSSAIKGANLRELNYKIFDLLYNDADAKNKAWYKKDMKIAYVGRGARSYDYIGKLAPRWLISWVIGCNSFMNVVMSIFGY